MKSIFILILVLFSKSALSDYPIYYYDEQKVKISNETFYRYIRPQIRNIVVEYYHLLKKHGPLFEDLIKIKHSIFKLSNAWKEWTPNCTYVTHECATTLVKFYETSRNLEQKIHLLQNKKLKVRPSTSLKGPFRPHDTHLHLLTLINRLLDLNFYFLHQLETIMITSGTPYSKPLSVKEKFSPNLHGLQLVSEEMLTTLLDKNIKEDFISLWWNFIKHLEQHVTLEQKQSYLIKRLGEFTIIWNSFHMKMTSGQITLPKKSIQVIKIMHNRWNSILKLYLKHTRFVPPLNKLKR
ncbi:MAG: hypothetical protein ISR65_03485 [Bacteriovoracaceae bacterium]|nr:hypothetical protein [Bacteriovoracaceae bacterium]